MNRRAFLHLAAAATTGSAATLTACSNSTPPVTSSPVTKPNPSSANTASTPKPPDWQALRSRISGGLVLPGDPGYDSARRSYNPMFDNRRPAAVARCAKPEDVRACVETARDSRIPIAARSGGHSYAGYSTPENGIVADLAKMSTIDIRPDGTAVIGAGARLIDVYAALAAVGRCLPAGTCPTVGIAGLTLGGGLGVLTRKYGLTCDRLTSAQVVTADGESRTASTDSEPDLFWALRGGGGGNFGVVTSFTFTTAPAPDLTVFSVRFPAGSAPEVVGAWQEWIASAPDELWAACVVSGGSPPASRVDGAFAGSAAALNSLLSQLISKAATPPANRLVQSKGYLEAMRYFAGCSRGDISSCRSLGRDSFLASSRVLGKPVADPAKLVALLDGRRDLDLLLDGLGGAVSTLDSSATAFPHRSALATAQVYQSLRTVGAANGAKAVAEVRDGLATIAGSGAYVNYIDPTMPDWATAYYGRNLDRLREVARRYDPDGVFTFSQSVARA